MTRDPTKSPEVSRYNFRSIKVNNTELSFKKKMISGRLSIYYSLGINISLNCENKLGGF